MSHLAISSFLLLNFIFLGLFTGCGIYKSQGRKTFEAQADGKLVAQTATAACLPNSNLKLICFQNSDTVVPTGEEK